MDAMQELVSAQADYRVAEIEVARARARRNAAARAAHAAGYRPGKIADTLGVSRGRVTQIIGAASRENEAAAVGAGGGPGEPR